MNRPEAIVVGAGFAGLSAARELERQGKRVLVLEGGDRLGGRTYTVDYSGQPLELGGTWVHWYQPHVWAEISRFGLEVIEVPPRPTWVWLSPSGAVRLPAAEIAARTGAGWEAFLADAHDAFPRPMEGWSPYLEQIDHLSMRERLDSINIGPDERLLLASQLEGSVLQSLEQPGVAQMGLKPHALASCLSELSSAVGSRYRLKAGMRSLYEAIAGEIRGEIMLGSAVAAVERTTHGLTVTTTDGTGHDAQLVVIAAPLNALRDMALPDDLDPRKQAFIAEGHAGDAGGKLFVRLRGEVEPFSATCVSGSPIARLKTDLPLSNGDMMVVGFGRRVDEALTPEHRPWLEATLKELAPNAEIADIVVQDWGRGPMSKGIWSVLRPYQVTRYLREMIRPQKGLAFSGSDLAIGWNGYVDGAIESGVRAARVLGASL